MKDRVLELGLRGKNAVEGTDVMLMASLREGWRVGLPQSLRKLAKIPFEAPWEAVKTNRNTPKNNLVAEGGFEPPTKGL